MQRLKTLAPARSELKLAYTALVVSLAGEKLFTVRMVMGSVALPTTSSIHLGHVALARARSAARCGRRDARASCSSASSSESTSHCRVSLTTSKGPPPAPMLARRLLLGPRSVGKLTLDIRLKRGLDEYATITPRKGQAQVNNPLL
jgi:hypothetical protein